MPLGGPSLLLPALDASVRLQQRVVPVRVLVANQAAADLRHRPRWDDRLGPRSGPAAEESVDFEWTYPAPTDNFIVSLRCTCAARRRQTGLVGGRRHVPE